MRSVDRRSPSSWPPAPRTSKWPVRGIIHGLSGSWGILCGEHCTGTENYLNPKYYPAYARYYAKFVSAYSGTYGIPIYMVSMQNEPQNCSSGYATMNLDATGAQSQ
jgi:hypothetical protein